MVDWEKIDVFKTVIMHNNSKKIKSDKLPALLTVKEVAYLLRKSPRCIRNWITWGDLPADKIRGSLYVWTAELVKFLEDECGKDDEEV